MEWGLLALQLGLAISRGYSIINLDALSYAACPENVESVSRNQKYSFEHVDIRNRKELDRIFLQYQPDAVMHLAAESHVDRSIDNPLILLKPILSERSIC